MNAPISMVQRRNYAVEAELMGRRMIRLAMRDGIDALPDAIEGLMEFFRRGYGAGRDDQANDDLRTGPGRTMADPDDARQKAGW